MKPTQIPFTLTNWDVIRPEIHAGETGEASWRTVVFGDLRIRRVDYSANYKADHWCEKGHLVFCLEGEMTTELRTGEFIVLKKGMSYQVSDELSSHRTTSVAGTSLIIVDGGFLAKE